MVFASFLLLFPQLTGASSTNLHTTWLWHMHQPIYWPDRRATGSDHCEAAWDTIQKQNAGRPHPSPEVLATIFGTDDRVSDYQARPFNALSSLSGYRDAGAQMSFSGALIENLQSLGAAGQLGYSSTWNSFNQQARALITSAGKPRLDLVNFTYHHALAPFLSDETLEMELRIQRRQMELFWGTSTPLSRGYFPAETCFSERLIPILAKVGITWCIVANNHLTRACADFPLVLGSGGENCDLPNPADQLNPPQGAGNYKRIGIERGCGPCAALPFAFQIHFARYVDPATGAESRLMVVPSDQALGWRDGYSSWDLGLLGDLAARNNPAKPALALFAHDGDNAWSGGYSYYMEWTPNLASQAAALGYSPSTVEQFLAENPPDTNDVVHVEDGGWVNADGDFGSPIFINWHWPPSLNVNGVNIVDPTYGTSDKADNWRVIIATENRVKTAQQVSGLTPRIDQVRDPGSFSTAANNIELGWHYYLASLDSGFVYYGCHDDECQRAVVAQSNAVRNVDPVLAANPAADTTPPTLFPPQRHPWNPGATNFGVQYGYKATLATNTDFWVWTYAYDVAGITNASLYYRNDGTNPPLADAFKTYAGGALTGPWQNVNMPRRVVSPIIGATPQYIADYYCAKVTGVTNAYIDYYVSATDARGNTSRSALQHVWVAGGKGQSATNSPSTNCPPFVLDGALDFSGYLLASNTLPLYAALRGTTLYVATGSPGNNGPNDYFLFVSDQLLPDATVAAPWAKSGSVAVATFKPYLAGESANSYVSWYNNGSAASYPCAKSSSTNGVMEGTLDLIQAFGSVPTNLYLCAAAYATADGGALTARSLAGTGPNLAPSQFLAIPLSALRDLNGDGVFDRLDPTRDFRLQSIQAVPAGYAFQWAAMPNRAYQPYYASLPTGPWLPLPNSSVTAAPLQLFLTCTDAPPLVSTQRFYRIKLQP